MSSKLESMLTYLKDSKARNLRLLQLLDVFLPDEIYLKKMFKILVGRPLNLDHPETYTEKIQWLKLYDRRPVYTLLQDKYAVRNYVKEKAGDEYLIPLLGAWDHAEEIDFDALPDQFVLKCNHDCASVIICRDKKCFDAPAAKEKLKKCLKNDYYRSGREWAYKDIRRKVIAEKYMQNGEDVTLTDYKFFCFSGKARMVMLASGEAHTAERRVDYFDMDFHPLPIKRGKMSGSGKTVTKPEGFDQLIPLAEKIAGRFPFIRVDFYLIDGHPYFGEIAFYPSGGFAEFSPYEWEKKIGSWIHLPE